MVIAKDIVYIKAYPEQKMFYMHGIDFKEFIGRFNLNLLVIRSNFVNGRYHEGLGLTYLPAEQVVRLADEDFYRHGDFCWVDYPSEKHLNSLRPESVIELLYLAHTSQPLASPFLKCLDNKFVYLSQDDGWQTRLYCRDESYFHKVLGFVIQAKLKALYTCDSVPPNSRNLHQLVRLLKWGMVFDFENTDISHDSVRIPLTAIGEITDPDDLPSIIRQQAASLAMLSYRNENWYLEQAN